MDTFVENEVDTFVENEVESRDYVHFGEKAKVRVDEFLVVYDVICLLTNEK